MKTYKKIIILFMVLFVFGYLLGSFSAADLNLVNWPEETRRTCAIMIAFVFVIGTVGIAMTDDLNRN